MRQSAWIEKFKVGLRKYLPALHDRLRTAVLGLGEKSYSQEGEDRVLARYFESVIDGFFVDVGAHDPIRFSNTFLFYKRGWRGVNIDAMPGSMRLFNKYRGSDINVEVGIGLVADVIPFYVFDEPALNSFDATLSQSRGMGKNKIVEVVEVQVRPLSQVLIGHVPSVLGPSFLTIDVEGRDLDALKSNDWTAFRPTFVLAECLGSTIDEAAASAVSTFMYSQGYEFVAKTANTAFYRVRDAG